MVGTWILQATLLALKRCHDSVRPACVGVREAPCVSPSVGRSVYPIREVPESGTVPVGTFFWLCGVSVIVAWSWTIKDAHIPMINVELKYIFRCHGPCDSFTLCIYIYNIIYYRLQIYQSPSRIMFNRILPFPSIDIRYIDLQESLTCCFRYSLSSEQLSKQEKSHRGNIRDVHVPSVT